MNDNQFTDAAQLVATHRSAHADTATARLAQVSPDATVPQHASIDTIRYLQARIRELRHENERLRRGLLGLKRTITPTGYPDYDCGRETAYDTISVLVDEILGGADLDADGSDRATGGG